MEAAIRWSPHSTLGSPQFLIVDVAENKLKLCEVESLGSKIIKYKKLAERDKLPNYTAFDWSKREPYFVAVGGASGEANLVRIDPEPRSAQEENIWSFPLKHQRKCNSIAFSPKNFLATGLERVRNDWCMNIYDLNVISSPVPRQQEPTRKLAQSESIASIKFFNNQPDTLICGVTRQCIRLFDLRGTYRNYLNIFFVGPSIFLY